MSPCTRTGLTRSGLLAAMLIALAPEARATVYEDAWDCASAVVDTAEVGLTTGPKVLKFIATQPSCIVRLGTPATAAPIGVVVGLANADVLPSSQPQCSAKLYETAAQPLALALDATLGELGVLPSGASDQLAAIAAGELAGEALTQIPGMSEVAGSLTCGCELVEAGLSVDAIEKVLATGDALGDACGGVVWDTAKEVAGEVVEFAGDAAEEGIRQVSNLGDALAGQTKHMPYEQYFNQHWLPRVEDFATMEYTSPGNWHDQKQWHQMWDPCVTYFDEHTQSEDTAQYTCDNMRSGGALFPERNFGRLMYRRLFDFDVSIAVQQAREQAHDEYPSLPLDIDLPAELAADADALAQLESLWDQQKPGLLRSAVDAVFGVPTREQTHDGLAVHSSSPPAKFAPGTLGARAQDYFGEVDANQDRADAARAVELAMADADLPARYAEQARDIKRGFYLKYYQFVLTMREHLRDKDQDNVDALARQCPTSACRDQITNDYAACRADVAAWYQDNQVLISDFDSSGGKAAIKEWGDRTAACLDQAVQTAKANRYHIDDAGAGSGPIVVSDPGQGRNRFESRVDDILGNDAASESNESSPDAQGSGRERFDGRRLDADAVESAVARDREARAGTGREHYRGREAGSERRVDGANANLEQLLQRRSARGGAREATQESTEAEMESVDRIDADVQPAREVGGDELSGCAAVRGLMNPRTYVCGTDEAYENCRRVTQGSDDVQCQRGRR